MKRNIIIYIAIFIATCLFGCTQPTSQDNTPKDIAIQGFAQKGQLVKGSQVTAFALTEKGVATGSSYPANISDNLGSFSLNISTNAPLLEVRTEGYYFNEITGSVSEAPIYLEAIAPSVSSNVNINILTTVIKPRIKHLLADGVEYSKAVLQAQQELLSAFGSDSELINKFTEIDIMGTDEGDAILLAYACIIQQNRSASEVVTLVQATASEFESEGEISQTSIATINANRSSVNPFSVVRNLAQFYSDKGIEKRNLPPFYKYIDDKYNTDFIIDTPDIMNSTAPDSGLNYEAVEASYDIISANEFEVECSDDFVTIEKHHILGNFYTVDVRVEENCGIEARTTEILFKDKSGKLLAKRPISQGVNLQIVELQIGAGTRVATTLENFDHPTFDTNDKIGVNDMILDIEVKSAERGIVKIPHSDSYFFSFPAGSVSKAGHIARVAVCFPDVITSDTPIPYYAGLESYSGMAIPNPAPVHLVPAVALVGFRVKGYDQVAHLVISGNGADDYLSGEFSYVPDKNSLLYFPDLDPNTTKGSGKSMKLTYKDNNETFWAILPPIDFNSGFSISLYNSKNEEIDTVKFDNSLSLKTGALITVSLKK